MLLGRACTPLTTQKKVAERKMATSRRYVLRYQSHSKKVKTTLQGFVEKILPGEPDMKHIGTIKPPHS
jgi:hypothetical protein